jgi:hypothetical protein
MRRGLVVLVLSASAGCQRVHTEAGDSRPRPAPATQPVQASATRPASPAWGGGTPKGQPAPASREASQPAGPADQVVVATDRGLTIYDAEGKLVRAYKGRPARTARYLAGRRAVVYLGGGLRGALGFQGVWRVDLVTGQETLVARMPVMRLVRGDPPGANDGAMQPDSDEGAWIEPPDRALCLRLVDGEGDTTNVALSMRIDLATGKITRRLDLALEGHRFTQPPLVEDKRGKPLCKARQWRDPSAPDQQLVAARARYPFFIDKKGSLVEHRGAALRRLPLFHREESDRPTGPNVGDYETPLPGPVFTESGPYLPPGRWVLLAGNHFRGDLFHTQYLVMDRQSGAIYRLPNDVRRTTPWPRPIPLAKLQRMKPLELQGLDVAYGAGIQAVGGNGAVAVSWTLFVPGVRAIPLHGEVAQ